MNELPTFEQSSGNVYADLGLAEPEALLAKAKLVRAIGKIVEGRGWTDRVAADTRPRPDDLYGDAARPIRGALDRQTH